MHIELFRIEINSFADILESFVNSLYPQNQDEFWEPVKVTVDLKNVPVIQLDNWECPICADEQRRAIKLPCCRKPMCESCSVSWFEKENVNCPFCRKDLRDYLSK